MDQLRPAAVDQGLSETSLLEEKCHNFVRNGYLDILMVTLSMGILIFYHASLARCLKKSPHQTSLGGQLRLKKAWIHRIMKDNDGKKMIAVQSIRNIVLECVLMANSYLMIVCGVGIFLAITNGLKNMRKELTPAIYGASGTSVVLLKFALVLMTFFSAFLCAVWAISCFNQVNFLINVSNQFTDCGYSEGATEEYVANLLCRACKFQMTACRISYAGFTLLVWLFGPIPMLFPPICIVLVHYHLDYSPLPTGPSATARPSIVSLKAAQKDVISELSIIDSSGDCSGEFTRFTVAFDEGDGSRVVDHAKRPTHYQVYPRP